MSKIPPNPKDLSKFQQDVLAILNELGYEFKVKRGNLYTYNHVSGLVKCIITLHKPKRFGSIQYVNSNSVQIDLRRSTALGGWTSKTINAFLDSGNSLDVLRSELAQLGDRPSVKAEITPFEFVKCKRLKISEGANGLQTGSVHPPHHSGPVVSRTCILQSANVRNAVAFADSGQVTSNIEDPDADVYFIVNCRLYSQGYEKQAYQILWRPDRPDIYFGLAGQWVIGQGSPVAKGYPPLNIWDRGIIDLAVGHYLGKIAKKQQNP